MRLADKEDISHPDLADQIMDEGRDELRLTCPRRSLQKAHWACSDKLRKCGALSLIQSDDRATSSGAFVHCKVRIGGLFSIPPWCQFAFFVEVIHQIWQH
ncbi:hypothetical protein D3C80_2002170 [compost metagenome]